MTNAALVHRPRADVWEAADWKKLCRSLCDRVANWNKLAVVPAGPAIAPELCLEFAVALAYAGAQHLGEQVDVANGTRIRPSEVPLFSREVERFAAEHGRIVIALSAFEENPASVALARAADAALLCVVLGAVSSPTARGTVAELGAVRFAGAVIVRRVPRIFTGPGRAGRSCSP